MLRLRIPRESVLNKIRFNGHDCKIIDLDENKSLEIQTKNHNLEQNNAIKPNELLLGMNKLKKVKKIEKPKNNITGIGLLQPPSKDDLLNAMKKFIPISVNTKKVKKYAEYTNIKWCSILSPYLQLIFFTKTLNK